jgi:GDP-D-mannose 3',5'-epimerase
MTTLPQPVVVLGGGGFIGSNLARRLKSEGNTVKSVDVSFPSWRHAGLAEGRDLRNYAETVKAVRGAGTVFHLAADMGGVEYFHSDKDFAASIDNQIITTNVVKACVSMNVARLVYTSSVCAANTSMQMTEGAPYAISEFDTTFGTPDARYGAEKRHGAYVVANAPLDSRVAFLNTVYGPGQEYHGVRMKFPSAVATGAIKSLDTGILTMFGNGNQIRPYLFIDDAVDMLITLASYEGEFANAFPSIPWLARTFVLGSDQPVSCKSVAETCLRIVGSDAEIRLNPDKPSGVLARTTDMRKWYEQFGHYTYTSIESGFTKFIDWLRPRLAQEVEVH